MKKIKIITALTLMLTIGITIIFGTTAKTYALEQDENGNLVINYEELEDHEKEIYFDSGNSYISITDDNNITQNLDLEIESFYTSANLDFINNLNNIFNNVIIYATQNTNFSYNGNNITFEEITLNQNRFQFIDSELYIDLTYTLNNNTYNHVFKVNSLNLQLESIYLYYESTKSYQYIPIMYFENDTFIQTIDDNDYNINFDEFEGVSDNYTNNNKTYFINETADTLSSNQNFQLNTSNYNLISISNDEQINSISFGNIYLTDYISIQDLVDNILISNIWYSKTNYDKQEEDLQELKQQYESYINYKNYGSLAYMKNIEIDSSEYQHEETINNIQELIDTNYYNYQNFEISAYTHEKGVNYYNEITINYKDNGVNADNIETYILVDQTYTSNMTCFISIYNITNQQTYNLYITPSSISDANVGNYGYAINNDNIKTYLENNNITQYYIKSLYLENFRSGDNIDSYTTIYVRGLDKNAYTQGYNIGYLTGKGSQQQLLDNANKKIKELEDKTNVQENTISSLKPQLEQLTINYEQLRVAYDDLAERYSQIQSGGNDLYHMIIAVADTPINIFKSIFNFDVLGINISSIVTMIVSLLVIVWLIKKLI